MNVAYNSNCRHRLERTCRTMSGRGSGFLSRIVLSCLSQYGCRILVHPCDSLFSGCGEIGRSITSTTWCSGSSGITSAELAADDRSWFSVAAAKAPTVNPPITNPRTSTAIVRRRIENLRELVRAGFRISRRPKAEYDTAASINGNTVIT